MSILYDTVSRIASDDARNKLDDLRLPIFTLLVNLAEPSLVTCGSRAPIMITKSMF